MLAHDGGTITCKTLWLGGGVRRGDGRLARQEALAAGAAIVRLGWAGVNGMALICRGMLADWCTGLR